MSAVSKLVEATAPRGGPRGAPSGGSKLVAAVLAVFCLLALVRVTDRPVIKDASETLWMAINLQHHGVMSLDHEPPYQASMARDPLPVWTTAAEIGIQDAVLGAAAPEQYFSGSRARLLKLQNMLWLAVLVLAAAGAMSFFGGSSFSRIAAAVLAALPFTFWVPRGIEYAIGMDSLDTELVAATFLLVGSLLLALAWNRCSPWLFAIASSVFGLLALTKAAVFYVFPVVVVILAMLHLIGRISGSTGRNWFDRRSLLALMALLLPFGALTGAWMERNLVQTGYFAMGERGGPVLLYRGMLDGMTGDEYRGAFFAWSDWPLNGLVGRLTGFSEADLGAHGRLRRLQMGFPGAAGQQDRRAEEQGRPELSITWYRESRAVYEKYLRDLTAAGARYPPGAADALTRQDGMRLVLQRPLMHLALFAPLIWRGAISSCAALLFVFVYAWRARQAEMAIFALPAFGLIMFYAMTSHFAQRYGWLPLPVATVGLIAVVRALFRHGWPDRKAPQRLMPGPATDTSARTTGITASTTGSSASL